MPRAKKPAGPPNMGGYGAQKITEFQGQPYGDRKASVDSQRAIPVPAVPGLQAQGQAQGPPVDTRARLEAALRAAQRMQVDPLFGPTQRPNEPLSAGMSAGPGVGPEMLSTGNRVSRTFRLLASVTGDPKFDELAELAALRGR